MYIKMTEEQFKLFLEDSKEHSMRKSLDRLELKKHICSIMNNDSVFKLFVQKYSVYKNISLTESFIMIEKSGIVDMFKSTGVGECDCDYEYWFNQLNNMEKGED